MTETEFAKKILALASAEGVDVRVMVGGVYVLLTAVERMGRASIVEKAFGPDSLRLLGLLG